MNTGNILSELFNNHLRQKTVCFTHTISIIHLFPLSWVFTTFASVLLSVHFHFHHGSIYVAPKFFCCFRLLDAFFLNFSWFITFFLPYGVAFLFIFLWFFFNILAFLVWISRWIRNLITKMCWIHLKNFYTRVSPSVNGIITVIHDHEWLII